MLLINEIKNRKKKCKTRFGQITGVGVIALCEKRFQSCYVVEHNES